MTNWNSNKFHYDEHQKQLTKMPEAVPHKSRDQFNLDYDFYLQFLKFVYSLNKKINEYEVILQKKKWRYRIFNFVCAIFVIGGLLVGTINIKYLSTVVGLR